jgi:Fe-S cluster assembly scaffold protein SufB
MASNAQDVAEFVDRHYEAGFVTDIVDFQAISYYAAPKSAKDKPQSLDEVDPKLLETYEKLGIPLHEQKMLAGVAVDAVFDSVSVPPRSRASWPKPA